MAIRLLVDEPVSPASVTEPAGPDPAIASVDPFLAAAPPQGASTAGPPRRYFDVSEVDEPAVPTPDWALDPQILVRHAVRSLKVQVWIGESGKPERCMVVSMEPSQTALFATIQRQLCSTRLKPAMLRGVAVPSVRNVEILLSQEE